MASSALPLAEAISDREAATAEVEIAQADRVALATAASDSTSSARVGRLIVITGPSGVGKGTLLAQLRQRHPELGYSTSATTRPRREGEVHGQHYFFLSRATFLTMRDERELLEWAEYASNFYGTPLQPVRKKIQAGEDIILEIELVGARQVAQAWPNALKVFIQPPSLDELERRLRDRAQDNEASINQRLDQAKVEIAAADEFDFVVVNDDFDRALAELEHILFAEN